MTSESILLYLIGAFVGLVLTVKVAGTIGFWVCSYILGNKLAALLEEDAGAAARQDETQHHGAPPWKVSPRRHPRRPRSRSL